MNLKINSDRFRASFEELSAIGATPAGGVHRPAFGPAHRKARQWFERQTRQNGLTLKADGAGNQSAVLFCGPPDGPHFLLGSHLDSVPFGGRFDGALGVAAALEVLAVIGEKGIRLDTHLEAIAFFDEEGAFVGLMGSRAMAGVLPESELRHPAAGRDTFDRALKEAGLSRAGILSAERPPENVAGYLELHVEQGRRLQAAGARIGVVTGFVGIRSVKLTFIGRADHAGTTPLDQRRDAAQGACAFAVAARRLVMERFPEAVATVGNMQFFPGVFNVVPQKVTLWLEFRAEGVATLDRMEVALTALAAQQAASFELGLEREPVENTLPVATDADMQAAIAAAARQMGLPSLKLPSGAGHDAQSLARICPVGMIFVPSEDGASHSERERTRWEDCELGANVLLQAVRLASERGRNG